jgi:hypothetical protein
VPLTCDEVAATDGTADCPAGCDGEATPATDGSSTCDLDATTDGTAACPAGCTTNVILASCTGESTEPLPCELQNATDGTAVCPNGCTWGGAATPPTELQTCDLHDWTDGTAACPVGCDYVPVRTASCTDTDATTCTGAATETYTCDFLYNPAHECADIGGIYESGGGCCPAACGSCGGSGCGSRPGGAANCCDDNIEVLCSDNSGVPPCRYTPADACPEGCSNVNYGELA